MTDRSVTPSAASTSAAAHRMAFDESTDGMLAAESSGSIITANESLLDILGRTRSEIVGQNWRTVLLNEVDAELRRHIDAELEVHRRWSGRVVASLPSGSDRLVDVRLISRPRLESRPVDGVDAEAGVEHGSPAFGSGWRDDMLVAYVAEAVDGTASLNAVLHEQVRRDGLTGVLNRRGFIETLKVRFEEAQRSGSTLSVLYIDLDNFKSLNDHFGHRYGDLLLEAFAKRLRSSIKTSDVIGRLGGDEFVVLFDPALPRFALENIVTKLRRRLLDDYQLDDVAYSCTASFGSAAYPNDATTVDELLEFADHAMYQAKTRGRDRHAHFDRHEFRTRLDRERLTDAIEAGIEKMEFVPYYQPLFDATTLELVGAEALARWIDARDGRTVRSPAEFLPMIEGGLAGVRLGLRMFDQVTVHARSFAALAEPIALSVNLSAAQLRSEEVVAKVESLAVSHPDVIGRLRIELTESAFYDGDPTVARNLQRILDVGPTLSLDDFGTGHSSLLSLRAHEFSEVKIDKRFLSALASGDEADRLLFESMIEMCRTLGLRTVCEGVETEQELAYVRSQGCDVVQGFLLGRPMPKEQFLALLRQQPAAN